METITQEQKFEVYQMLGDCYVNVGQYDKARENYAGAIAIDKGSEKPHIGLGVISMLEGKHSEAKINFETAVRMNRKNEDALVGLGMVLANYGDHLSAITKLGEALDLNASNTNALLYLLKSAYHTNKFNEAERYLTNYVALHPEDTSTAFGLAGVYYKQGKVKLAKDTLTKILEAAPDHKEARDLLAKMPA